MGREAGAGENPPGRHPEWLISADESLFSFRLNTLNRAPSDVYLHSLRANAGGGPRRRQGHAGPGAAGELRGSSAVGMAVAGRKGVFPGPSPLKGRSPGACVPPGGEERGQPRECIPAFWQQAERTGGDRGGPVHLLHAGLRGSCLLRDGGSNILP